MIKLEKSWKKILKNEFEKTYWKNLTNFIRSEISMKKLIFPAPKNVFAGFYLCPFDSVKVVIIGQDPYHSTSLVNGKVIPTAHGLCFSVAKGAPIPPSLKNIYKELKLELRENFEIPTHGNLEKWARQGVLLLNTTLTVEAGKPMSHSKKGWVNFTDEIIRAISCKKDGVIFILWGKHAQKKKLLIDLEKHFVLESPHPSPLSAHRGFFGNGHFEKTNNLLLQQNKEPINWQL